MKASKSFRVKLKCVGQEIKELSKNSIFTRLVRNEFKFYYFMMGGILLCFFI